MLGYQKKQLGPVNVPALFENSANYVEEARNLDLDTMDRYELLKVANSFRVVIIVYSERLSNLSSRLDEKEKEIVRLRQENLELREKISKLEIPDYIPKDQRIQEWLKGRELDYEKQRADIENDKILAQGKVAAELGEVLKDNKYAPHAITSLLKHATGNKTGAGLEKVSENPILQGRIKEAELLGFTWQTRGSKRPSRESTCLKLLSKWEAEYEKGKDFPISRHLDIAKVVREGDGAMCAVINRITEIVGGKIDLGEGKNNYNRLQKAVKLYRDSQDRTFTPALLPVSSNVSVAERLTEAVFGEDIDPRERESVISIYTSRLDKCKGVENATPGLVRKVCHLNRLPIFFKWREEHRDPHSKLKALKQGEYDEEYRSLLEKVVVESSNREGG
jgi:regulator of replication initiation timing